MRLLRLLPLLLALSVSGCGILVGQFMVAGTGLKNLQVVSGDPASFERGARTLILAPFDTAPGAYDIARGDDEARLGVELGRRGTIEPLYRFLPTPGEAEKTAAELKKMDGEAVAAKLGLEEVPRYLMTGTVLSRDTVVAPMKGVVMEVSYRIEVTDLTASRSWVVEASVKDLFPEAVPDVAEGLDKLWGGAKK